MMKRALLILLVLFPAVLLADTSTPTKKYPPYPEVWDWVIPFPDRLTRYFQANMQPDGDVRISYRLTSKAPQKMEEEFPQGGVYGATFFARKTVQPAEDIVPYPIQRERRVTLQSGKRLLSIGAFRSSNGCFDRVDQYLVLQDSEGKELVRKYLLYVLDKPKRFKTRDGCRDGTDFTYQVEAIPARLVPLEDGTFLVVDGEHGLAIRCDGQFTTRSSLLNQRVFVMDLDAFWRAGDYGSREEDNRNWQKFEDELYRHLMSSKGRK